MTVRPGILDPVGRALKRSGHLRAVVHTYRRNFGTRAGPYPRTRFGQLADTIHWQLRHNKDMRRILANAMRLEEIAPTGIHRRLAADLLDALCHAGPGDHRESPQLSIAATAMQETDTRAEKFVSARYRSLWIANCKVASRSMIAALCEADPSARVIKGRSVEELAGADPAVADYRSFAFVRHPYRRAYSFYADKILSSRSTPRQHRRFIESWHGLESRFSFAEFCEWLDTPYGSDHFAERHWVSQDRTLRGGATA